MAKVPEPCTGMPMLLACSIFTEVSCEPPNPSQPPDLELMPQTEQHRPPSASMICLALPYCDIDMTA
eukprot:2604496-Amphidinium_carterae.1